VELIANMQQTVDNYVKKAAVNSSSVDDKSVASVDVVFKYGFHKGITYMEEEMRINAQNQDVGVVDEFLQEDTDWEVSAVEDEDAL